MSSLRLFSRYDEVFDLFWPPSTLQPPLPTHSNTQKVAPRVTSTYPLNKHFLIQLQLVQLALSINLLYIETTNTIADAKI